jgi:hypothetical protein
MPTYTARTLDATKILTRWELAAVLAELRRKAPRSPSTRLNLIVFRLATCCGLRASEIAELRIADVRVELSRPHIKIRTAASRACGERIEWPSGPGAWTRRMAPPAWRRDAAGPLSTA